MAGPAESPAERRARLALLFEQALALDPAARDDFLARACGDDPELREELRSLLAVSEASAGYFAQLGEAVVAPALASLARDTPVELSAGDRVSHYEILERVAYGGMGVVYRARDLRLGRLVALKVLPAHLGGDDAARARLTAEARMASSLDHPNIAVVHEVGEDDAGGLYIAMGWYEGESLKDRLQRGALGTREALAVAVQLADALAAAHGSGVVHRDVKPANVLITGDGVVKLLDFGIAKVAGAPRELTKEGTTLGTIGYMSPEQTRGQATDARTDLWSLGVVLYELLTGDRPFRGADDQAVIYAIRHDEPAPLARPAADVPPELADLVAECLNKTIEERPATAAVVRDRLRAMLTDASIHTARPGRHARHPRFHRRTASGLRFAGMAVMVIVAVGAISVYVNGGRPAPEALRGNRVVVAPFENRTGESALEAVTLMAADWIIQGLAQTSLVDVVPVTATLASTTPSDGGANEQDMTRRAQLLARETGAGIVVGGAVYRHGDSLYLRATITDVARQRLLSALEPIAMPASAPLPGIEHLRADVMRVLAPRLFPDTGYAPVLSSPPSFESYRAFMEGLKRFIAHDWRGAIPHFAEAAARDTTFTLPLVHAAVAFSVLGDFGGADSILALLRERAHTLNDVEHVALEMLEARVRGDYETFHRASLRAPEAARGTALPWMLTNTAMWVNRPHEALRVARRLEMERGEQRRWLLYWRDYTGALHRLGSHREELRIARKARALFPGEIAFVALEVRALAALGRPGDIHGIMRAGERPPTPRALREVGLELIAHGSRSHGTAFVQQSIEWQLAEGPRTAPARLFAAEGHYLLGEYEAAEAMLAGLEPEARSTVDAQGLRGVLAAQRGAVDVAESSMSLLAGMEHPYLHGRNTYWRARIAAVLGARDQAVRLLRQSYREGFLIWGPMHVEPDFAPLRDYPPFRELEQPVG